MGAINVAFVWCPEAKAFVAAGQSHSYPAAQLCYPGDQYVDYICVDGYDRSLTANNGPGFKTIFNSALLFSRDVNQIPSHSAARDFVVGETGAQPDGCNTKPAGPSGEPDPQQAAWIGSLAAEVTQFPYIEAVLYFDANGANDYFDHRSRRRNSAIKYG